jgi:hypothetical protein
VTLLPGEDQTLQGATNQAPPPAIVLVRPQLGENIGKAARAMLNFGLTDLRLVAPRDGWPNPAPPKRWRIARTFMRPRCESAGWSFPW